MEINGSVIKEVSKILKTPYILITLVLASGLLLFLPNNIIEKMYLLNFRNNFGFILGLIFWFSITLFIVMIGVKKYEKYDNKRVNKKIKEHINTYLKSMTDKTEIEIISRILKEDDYTLELPINSGLIIKLQHNFIISPTGNTYYVEMDNPCIPYFLQPGVLNAIENDDDLKNKFKYIN